MLSTNILKQVLETKTEIGTPLTLTSVRTQLAKTAPASFLFRNRSHMILHIFLWKTIIKFKAIKCIRNYVFQYNEIKQ